MTMTPNTRLLYLLLALDIGASFGCSVLLLAALRDRRDRRAGPASDAASAGTSGWQPGWNAPTAPMPTVAAVDPWAESAAAQPSPTFRLPAVPPRAEPVGALAWDGPTCLLPRVEARRRIAARPRNDAPAAAEPGGRYIEMVLTRRA